MSDHLIELAELVVILVLVLLLNRSRDHEVKAVLDVMADGTAERAELLNAARHPHYLLSPRQSEEPGEPDTEHQATLENLARIGRVGD